MFDEDKDSYSFKISPFFKKITVSFFLQYKNIQGERGMMYATYSPALQNMFVWIYVQIREERITKQMDKNLVIGKSE